MNMPALQFTNCNIELETHLHLDLNIPSIINVDIVELPPHYRTIKTISKQRYYVKLPYIQFYFTKLRQRNPVTFITGSYRPYSEETPKAIQLPNLIAQARICWGDDEINVSNSNEQLLDYFWHSAFMDKFSNTILGTKSLIIPTTKSLDMALTGSPIDKLRQIIGKIREGTNQV